LWKFVILKLVERIKNLKSSWQLPLVIFLGFLVRFIFLDKIPNAIGGDELTYILTAKSIALTGKDLTQTWNPLSLFFFNYPPGQNQAELLYFLQIPFVGFIRSLLFSTRVLNLILGTGLIYLMYLIARELFDRKTALIAALVTSFNPWSIYIGRTAYESIPAAFLYMLGFYVLLRAKEKTILFSIPVFFLAFYSYIGTKIIFLPFVILTVLYSYLFINKKKYRKYYLIVLALCFILVAFFTFKTLVSPASRASEILTPFSSEITKTVNTQRHLFVQTPLTSIFENKYSEFIRISIAKLFKIFSFDFLFIFGDQFYSINRNGLFYVLDLFFILLSIGAMYVKKRKLLAILSLFIILTAVPHILHSANDSNFSFHLTLLVPFLILLIAYGINEFLSYFNGKAFYIVPILLVSLYIILITNFLNIYFFQHPLMGNFDFKLRLLSKYISLHKGKKFAIYSNGEASLFEKYIFYTDYVNSDNKEKIATDITEKNYSLGNVQISGCDSTIGPAREENKVIIFDTQCNYLGKDSPSLKIARLADGGADFVIFNDNLCSKYNLRRYPNITSLSSFDFEKMNSQRFCETFITR